MSTITIDRAVVEQALEALEEYAPQHGRPDDMMDAITALRAVLAQPDDWTRCHHCGQTMPPVPLGQAEPVQTPMAWMSDSDVGFDKSEFGATPTVPLYTAPPRRTMVPLTEEEMYAVEEEARKNFRLSQQGPRGQQITYWDGLTPWLIRATEKASWEKNHGQA